MRRVFIGIILGSFLYAGTSGMVTLRSGHVINFIAMNHFKQCQESAPKELIVTVDGIPTIYSITQIDYIELQNSTPSGEGWWCMNADITIVLLSGESIQAKNASLKSLNLTIENPNNNELMAIDLFFRKGQNQGGGLNIQSINFIHQ